MNNLKRLREAKGQTLKEIASELKISDSTYSQWETEKRQPDNITLVKLADYFNVSIDYILGRENKSDKITHFVKTNELDELIKKLSLLQDEDLFLVDGYIDKILERNKKTEKLIGNK